MKTRIRVTALTEEGGSIQSGWFMDVAKGEAFAAAMTRKGYVVVREY